MVAVMIGVDPHKGSHTAVAIGAGEEPPGELRVRASAVQAERLLAWAAVSPAAAFLAAHRLAAEDEAIVINQGRFLGRPSVIAVTPDGRGDLWVGGPVAPVARGVVDLPSD
jgi:predicted PhzF superfamily epimerase YddE/YHI9